MSEYQYYEFLAIDKPLNESQLEAVGQFSSRAQITPTRFVNVYSHGDFRGDVQDFLSKYYDALVYIANWGTHRFMFRVPKEIIGAAEAKVYCPGDSAQVRAAGQHVVFDLCSEEEEGGGWEDGEGWMDALAGLREELIGGDRRVLYLAWLLAVQAEETGEDAPEPPVPPGLAKLTKAQKNLADFLRLDGNLIAAAARESLPAGPTDEGLAEWIAALPDQEKNAMLVALCNGDDPHVGRKLHRRFQMETKSATAEKLSAKRRTAAEIRRMAAGVEQQGPGRRKAK
jgi:hypothetical protein